jgi:hypothetical protein
MMKMKRSALAVEMKRRLAGLVKLDHPDAQGL